VPGSTSSRSGSATCATGSTELVSAAETTDATAIG